MRTYNECQARATALDLSGNETPLSLWRREKDRTHWQAKLENPSRKPEERGGSQLELFDTNPTSQGK